MAYILNLETSSTNCSVALSFKGEVIYSKEHNSAGYSHAEKLHIFIDEVLQSANIAMNDLKAIAVGKGPGSYTGLRIGVATAKGLCYALSIPLIAVNTLESLALQVNDDDCYVIAMLDARRMEVYDSIFHNKQQIGTTRAVIINSKEIYKDYLNNKENLKVYFIGSGVSKSKEFISNPTAVFLENNVPSALTMAPLAFQYYQEERFENVAYFDPLYLKEFNSQN